MQELVNQRTEPPAAGEKTGTDKILLEQCALAALREFFELLDWWDLEELDRARSSTTR